MTFLRHSFWRLRSRRASGFTLVELLVVIAIIAILASLIIAGLSKAIKTARNTKCVHNLHQLHSQGLAMAARTRGYFPHLGMIAQSYDNIDAFWLGMTTTHSKAFSYFKDGELHSGDGKASGDQAGVIWTAMVTELPDSTLRCPYDDSPVTSKGDLISYVDRVSLLTDSNAFQSISMTGGNTEVVLYLDDDPSEYNHPKDVRFAVFLDGHVGKF
ncbi:MAG: prepilin-type N-terminal cleavage/methylation domain-containing protein [Verrucomicrobia bacterium]|nr:prepilin-type N-terminal cleavage/methylation domain-containing protein [Verrucomicrobiota bacterium]MDA1086469.1 prepilin-type N-terminal cleavage/methylation domain-containing protein [Verrucomicrobiota bacterium]